MSRGSAVEAEVKARGITRLCHFTPSRNLAHIVAGKKGILATGKLQADERSVYTATDLQRLDGFTEHVCCSIEYPNAWYFERVRGKELLFKDWVVLLVTPKYLWMPGTRFCPRNAAAGYGQEVAEGVAAFKLLFAERTIGAYSRTYIRSPLTASCCPTDEQAEVLVPDLIELHDIVGIAVRDEDQARTELVRLELLGIPHSTLTTLAFIVAPAFWNKYSLSAALESGKHPVETKFDQTIRPLTGQVRK